MDTLLQHEILYGFMYVHLKATKMSDMSNGVKTLFTFDWILPVSNVFDLLYVWSLQPLSSILLTVVGSFLVDGIFLFSVG